MVVAMTRLVVGIIGLGVVGGSVLRALHANQTIINARAGKEIYIKKIVVRDLVKAQEKLRSYDCIHIELSTCVDDLINDNEIEVIIELMGGVNFAYEIAQKTLRAGKGLVTANKAMLAYHRCQIASLAGSLPVGFEASVCGGIPIIRVLKDGLNANHILSIRGILNGTSNYILTQMITYGQSFEKALKQAQELGYAESNPTLDIGGGDAGAKLLILASLAYGIHAKPEDILIEGIENVGSDDVDFANEFGYVIKLLGIAKTTQNKLELRVHPTMIPKNAMISKVDDVMNGISVVGDCVGESMYYGAGAGGDATASSVISDIISIARGENFCMFGFAQPLSNEIKTSTPLTLQSIDEIYSRYYIRLYVYDKPGVLGQISQILGQHNISISVLLQNQSEKGIAKMLFSTHHSYEREIRNALLDLKNLDCVVSQPYMIRIEDEA